MEENPYQSPQTVPLLETEHLSRARRIRFVCWSAALGGVFTIFAVSAWMQAHITSNFKPTPQEYFAFYTWLLCSVVAAFGIVSAVVAAVGLLRYMPPDSHAAGTKARRIPPE